MESYRASCHQQTANCKLHDEDEDNEDDDVVAVDYDGVVMMNYQMKSSSSYIAIARS